MKTHTIKTPTAELETLKNQYAQEQGYKDWETFLNHYGGRHPEWFEQHWTEICIRAEKAALEKAAENVTSRSFRSQSDYVITCKDITNPENLIR